MKEVITSVKFDLPEESDIATVYVKALDFALTCYDMDNYLRNRLKYEELPKKVSQALQAARDKLNKIMQDRNIHTDMIP